MLGHRPLICTPSNCCDGDEGNPREELDIIIELCRDILLELSNFQAVVNIDLTPVLSSLQKILAAMEAIANNLKFGNNQIKTAIDNLGNRFVEIIAPVELVSTNLETLIAILKNSPSVVNNIVNNEIVERKYYQFIWMATAGDTDCIVEIPPGAIEVSLVPYTCYDYEIDGKFYGEGHHYVRTARSIGNTVLVEPACEIKLPPKAKLHISYTSLRNIGDCVVVDGELSPSDDAALAAIIAAAEDVVTV